MAKDFGYFTLSVAFKTFFSSGSSVEQCLHSKVYLTLFSFTLHCSVGTVDVILGWNPRKSINDAEANCFSNKTQGSEETRLQGEEGT